MPLHIVKHPIAESVLTGLRDKNTKHDHFRSLCTQLTKFVVIEATRHLDTVEHKIHTPLEPFTGKALAQTLVAVPILRAGLAMLGSVIDLVPDVTVGYIGLERNEFTAKAQSYYCKLPDVSNSPVLILDPMLATGGSAIQAARLIANAGAKRIIMANIVSAPEGVAALEAEFPKIEIYTASLDRELNEKKYIMPGLGDFGDRLYGT
jgi:uracil phosphoribosyltransferase